MFKETGTVEQVRRVIRLNNRGSNTNIPARVSNRIYLQIYECLSKPYIALLRRWMFQIWLQSLTLLAVFQSQMSSLSKKSFAYISQLKFWGLSDCLSPLAGTGWY